MKRVLTLALVLKLFRTSTSPSGVIPTEEKVWCYPQKLPIEARSKVKIDQQLQTWNGKLHDGTRWIRKFGMVELQEQAKTVINLAVDGK